MNWTTIMECLSITGSPLIRGKSPYELISFWSIGLIRHREVAFRQQPEDISLDIVYEDDDLLVINKQAGLVVHPGHGNYTGTLVNALAYRYKDLPLYGGDDPRPGLVHRIDKNTTGLLVVAKTEMAKNHLAQQFFEKTTKRKPAGLYGFPGRRLR